MNLYFTIGTILILFIFYSIYIIKFLQQRRQGIQTNQMGKGSKDSKTMRIEKILNFVSRLVVLVQIISIVMQCSMFPTEARVSGILLGLMGDIIFALAVFTMRDSWRAGIPKKDETKIITEGIFHYSRNPAFLGFYFVYIGILIVFFNPILLVMTGITIVVFHLQVLQEEKFLQDAFGEDYTNYRKTVYRYLGRKVKKGDKS